MKNSEFHRDHLQANLSAIAGPWLMACFIAWIAMACDSQSKGFTLSGPDSSLTLHVYEGDTAIQFHVDKDGNTFLKGSKLGLQSNLGNLFQGLRLKELGKAEEGIEEYKLLHGKQSQISKPYTEQKGVFVNEEGLDLHINFRVFDDGIAYQYFLPNPKGEELIIEEEKGTFSFSKESLAWLQPKAEVNTGFAATNPSYEEHYLQNIQLETTPEAKAGWVYPLLLKEGDTWFLLSEAGGSPTYCGTNLTHQEGTNTLRIKFPQAGEVMEGAALVPESTSDIISPWRFIVIGTLGQVVESTLGTDLAEASQISTEDYIKPGIAAWSWALLKDESVNYETQKEFIDYAAQMNWPYSLIDVSWDLTIGYDGIQELADYAKSKDVSLILWYNSSGDWNETDFTPKSRLLKKEERREEFKKISQMGIAGIKVDFFGGDGQGMMQYYRDILEDAADFQLLVNCHGSTLPRGLHRTYPNLMTMEAVKGLEFITFEQENADLAPSHCAMLPFTRNVFDPMDFTPMVLDSIPGIKRRTQASFEIVLPLLFNSGIQHLAETPLGMSRQEPSIREFLKDIPVSWDESHFLGGYPGKWIAMAKRANDQWFIMGINAEEDKKEMEIDMSFLDKASESAVVTGSDGSSGLVFSSQMIQPEEKLKFHVPSGSGFILKTSASQN